MDTYNCFKLTMERHVAIVRMNRPPANAFNMEFAIELETILSSLENDPSVRVVVLGSCLEKIFSTGADINMMFEMDTGKVHRTLSQAFLRIQSMPKPVIAMINGHALGGGCELAMCCDFRYMRKESGTIGLPEINLGIIPASGGTQRLPRLVGRAKAMELLLEGTRLDADEALRVGLVNRVFSSDKLERETMEYAHRLATRAPIAIGLIKKCVKEGMDEGLIRGLDIERTSLLSLLETSDAREGVQAFFEKRKANFEGK